jgi:L-asparaginase
LLRSKRKIAAATSTGGKGFEVPGRISDSATVAGNYANPFCGVSLTGVGEDIMSNATAAKIARVTDGFTLEEAFAKTFEELKSYDLSNSLTIVYFFASFDGDNFEVFE